MVTSEKVLKLILTTAFQAPECGQLSFLGLGVSSQKPFQALKGRYFWALVFFIDMSRPFRALGSLSLGPRALPWAIT